jgi:hypothetical protein
MSLRLWFFTLALFAGCANVPSQQASPPSLVESQREAGKVILHFDRNIAKAQVQIAEKGQSSPPMSEIAAENTALILQAPATGLPGHEYVYHLEVHDDQGNTLGLTGSLWAANPHPAKLKLSEVRTQGSGTRPDAVELEVQTAGGLAGLCLDYLANDKVLQRFNFPDTNVRVGDFLVLVSGSAGDVSSKAQVFSWNLPQGFSSSAGLVVLRTSPDSGAQDVFLYARDPLQGGKLLRGYEKKTGGSLKEAWTGPPWRPEGASASRTFCRKKPWAKVSGVSQWVLVATGSASLGSANRLIPWVPASLKTPSAAKASKKKTTKKEHPAPASPS